MRRKDSNRSNLDVSALRIALVMQNRPDWAIAIAAGISAPSFSSFKRGARQCPNELVPEIEKALGLAPGALVVKGGAR